jgi:hypothetical protein
MDSHPLGQIAGEALITICGLMGVAALLFFLTPRTPKYTFWVLMLVLVLSLPLLLLVRSSR